MRRILVPVIAAIGLALSIAAPAPAAIVEHTASVGPAEEDFMYFHAGKREHNRLTITVAKKTTTFRDKGATLRRKKGDFGGCRFTRHTAVCKIDPFMPMIIDLGDKNDSVRFKGSANSTLGPTARTDAKDVGDLGDLYEDSEGSLTEYMNITGGKGNDTIYGTRQHDVIDPGLGADKVDGGRGNDRIGDTPDGSADKLLGGGGIDTVDASGSKPVTIDLAAPSFKAGTESDSLNSFERARGGEGDDTLTGTDGPDGLFGDSGSDTVDGLGGNDYLGGDLPNADAGSPGAPGADTLTGGPGGDILDGRDDGVAALSPTDKLGCGDGGDLIVGLQQDLADASCESSAWGTFTGDLEFDQQLDLTTKSTVPPVARAAGDGAPTYRIACPQGSASGTPTPCSGRVQLERPPMAGSTAAPEVFGSGDFTIAAGSSADVPVTLTPAGKTAIAQPGALAAVHVLMGEAAKTPGQTTAPAGSSAEFGWQQQLGP